MIILSPGLTSIVNIGGTSVQVADNTMGVSGGLIINPRNAVDQGIPFAESIFVDLTGKAPLYATPTTTEIVPGQWFLVPPQSTVWVNASSNGHQFAGIFSSPYIVPPAQLVPGQVVKPFLLPNGQQGLFASASLQNVIPAYLYQEYSDDDDLQGMVDSLNSQQQNFVDTFNALNLPIYCGPIVQGALLDWVGQGLYGMARPTLSSGKLNLIGPLNTWGCGITEISSATDQPIPVISATWSAGTATVLLAAPVAGISVGDTDEIYLRDFVGVPQAVTSATWAAEIATITFPGPVGGITVGNAYELQLAGFDPPSWDGLFWGSFTATDTFTYSLKVNPTAMILPGTAQFSPWNDTVNADFSATNTFTFPMATSPGTTTALGTAQSLLNFFELPAVNMIEQVGAIEAMATNDDTYRRILTWHFYKGDGKYFNSRWLERRVWRFCYGINGTAPNAVPEGAAAPSIGNTSQISISQGVNKNVTIRFVLGQRTIEGGAIPNMFGCNGFGPLSSPSFGVTPFVPITQNDLETTYTPYPTIPFMHVFQEAVASGVIETPAELDFTVAIG